MQAGPEGSNKRHIIIDLLCRKETRLATMKTHAGQFCASLVKTGSSGHSPCQTLAGQPALSQFQKLLSCNDMDPRFDAKTDGNSLPLVDVMIADAHFYSELLCHLGFM